MTELATQFHRKLEIVAEVRLRVTGRTLEVPAAEFWRVDRFESLVSSIYKLLREAWRVEVEFVRRSASVLVQKEAEVRRYCVIVGDLRQSEQHSNPQYQGPRERWLLDAVGAASLSDDKEVEACQALLRDGTSAMSSLVGLCKHLENDPLGSKSWSQFVDRLESSDPATALAIIAGDLGVGNNSRNTRGYLEREVQKAWSHRAKSLTAHDDYAVALESEILRVLAGQFLGSIPCGYSDLLEALDLNIGSREAFGAVLVAHGIALMADYDDVDEFLSLVSTSVAALGST